MEPKRDTSFWQSKLKDAGTCLQLYKLKHIDKVPLAGRSLDAECGTALHLGVAGILLNQDGVDLALDYWDKLDTAGMQQFRYDKKALTFCLKEWLRKFKKSYAADFEPFKIEERIYTQVGGHDTEGTPDFLGYYQGVPTVADWKTASSRYDARKIYAEEQMVSYAAYAEQEMFFKAKQTLYLAFVKDFTSPSIQKPLIRQLTDVVLSSTMQNMVEQIEDLKSRKVFFKNKESCVRGSIICPAFKLCHPDYQEEA